MLNGIFKITFRGTADWGMGILILKDGIVTGADVGGVIYDGSYTDKGDMLSVNLILTVPPGVTLVMGTSPQPKEYSFPFDLILEKQAINTMQPVLVHLPQGSVNVIFSCLREL